MSNKKSVTMMAVIVCGLAFTRPVRAQGTPCGMQCNSCIDIITQEWGRAGDVDTTNPAAAHWDKFCVPEEWFDGCFSCSAYRVASGTTADAFAKDLSKAASAQLASMIKRDRGRVLVSTTRNLLVVQGTTCNPNAFAAVIFITKDRAMELSRLGVRSLESYSAEPVKALASR